MRAVVVGLLSIFVGIALGVGSTWARFGFSTSAEQIARLKEDTTASAQNLPATRGGKVEADRTEFDFGPVEGDSQVSTSFRFTNRGTGPLELKQGGTTCQKCTIAELERSSLDPGESMDVNIEYHASTGTNKFRQSATILTNDPDRPRVELTVSGEVTSIFNLVPNEVVFSKLSVHDAQTIDVRLTSSLSDSLAVTGHEWNDPATANFFEFTQELLPAEKLAESEAKSGLLLHVGIKPGLPLGMVRQRLRLATNLPNNRTIEVPVQATIASDLSVAGGGWDDDKGMLNIGPVARAEGAKRTLLVLVRGPYRNDVRFQVGQVEPSFLKAKMEAGTPINNGAVQQWRLDLEIPPDSPPANHLGSKLGRLAQVTLETTHPEAKQLKVLVRFAVEN